LLCLVANANAALTRVDVASSSPFVDGKTFDEVGAYTRITGRFYGELDPHLPANKAIVDLAKAPRNARGKVEYSAELDILRPTDAAKGNGTLLYDVNNRGRKVALREFNEAPASNTIDKPEHAGDGFLMRQGFTIVWSGWQGDVLPGGDRLTARRFRQSGVITGMSDGFESLHYLLELIETSRLRPRSRAMADYIGRKSVERGRAFNDRVADELSAIIETPVRRRVTKLGRLTIADERGPLGDIDVLAIDQSAMVIWAVECKSLAPSRIPAEVANELRDLYGERGRPGHIGKHTRLVQWLDEHRGQVIEELGLEGDWRIEGLFVVDDDLYGPYFREAPVPVIPLRRLHEFVRSGGGAGAPQPIRWHVGNVERK
jgi:hypothetical protein